MGPTWGTSGADRTQVGPVVTPRILLSGMITMVYSRCVHWKPRVVMVLTLTSLVLLWQPPVPTKLASWRLSIFDGSTQLLCKCYQQHPNSTTRQYWFAMHGTRILTSILCRQFRKHGTSPTVLLCIFVDGINTELSSNKFLLYPHQIIRIIQVVCNAFCRNLKPFCLVNSGVLCQKQVSSAGTSNYIPHILWDVITCPCPWYLLLGQHPLTVPISLGQVPCYITDTGSMIRWPKCQWSNCE